jgi:hypothetical protein
MQSYGASIVALAASAVVIVAVLISGPQAASAEPQYVGVKDCGRCHKKELVGDQLGAWKEDKHAKAMETLRGEEAAKIATERGLTVPAWEADECVRCHATAHGLEKAQIYKKPLDVSDGVQCESCHGPGSDYRKKTAHAKSREKGLAAGMWEPDKNEKICTDCHNSDSPTFVSFDFKARKKEIEHPIPEEAKGRVLELEKAARKK